MRALRRVLVTALVLLACVSLGGPVAFWVFLHYAWAQPDVHKQVESADMRQRHAAAVAATDRGLAAFLTTAPHATRFATAIRDRCQAVSVEFGRPTTSCERRVTVYLGLDGDRTALQRAWTSSVAAAGWRQPYPAPVPSAFQQFESGDVAVDVTWRTRPATVTPVDDLEKGIPDKDYDGQVTLQQQAVDVAQVYREAYAHHRFVVELSTDNRYYPGTLRPSPTPSQSWNGCFGGHGNCPGG